MRVLYFHQHFSTPDGSTGIRSYEMAKCLISRGHSVIMVCGSYNGATTGLTNRFKNGFRRGFVDGIDIIELDLEYSNSHNFFSRAYIFIIYAVLSLKFVFSEKYDILFATSTPLTAGIPGIIARWIKFKPFMFEVRDLWPELPKAMGAIKNPIILGILSVLEWTIYHSANSLVALSPGIYDGIKNKGIKSENIKLIPNGCDLDIFDKTFKEKSIEGILEKDFVALFSGTHGMANGLDNLLKVAIELKYRKRNDIKLLLVGNGKLKKQLEDKAFSNKLDNVIFSDALSKTELARLMSRCDLGLQVLANVPAFYYGTSPNKFFDYISSGLPVLNNYPGWISDLIIENNCGFSVEPDNAVAFADILELAASDIDGNKIKGKNAKLLAKREFNRKDLAVDWACWLERLVH